MGRTKRRSSKRQFGWKDLKDRRSRGDLTDEFSDEFIDFQEDENDEVGSQTSGAVRGSNAEKH